MFPGLRPDFLFQLGRIIVFSPRLRDKIWAGLGTRLGERYIHYEVKPSVVFVSRLRPKRNESPCACAGDVQYSKMSVTGILQHTQSTISGAIFSKEKYSTLSH